MPSVETPAILLRAHPYGDTSRILRFYTRGQGLLSVVARGVRGKGGKGTLTLQTFATGTLSAHVRPQRDLHTMKDFTCTVLRSNLGAHTLRFAGASLVGEIVLAHSDQDPRPEVFEALTIGLDRIAEVDEGAVPAACLAGAWGVVVAFGYAPELETCTRCAAPLEPGEVGRFDFGAGGVLCASCGEGRRAPRVGPEARAQIQRLLEGVTDPPPSHPERHLSLLADFVAFHLADRPLKSFRFFAALLPSIPGS